MAEGEHRMDAERPSVDRAAELAERGVAARRRAAEAEVRAAELRGQLDAAVDGAPTRGSSHEDVTRSRRQADTAGDSMQLAFERGAEAHERAADLHERQIDTDPTPDGPDDHARLARHHRGAAEADRKLGREAREGRRPPAG